MPIRIENIRVNRGGPLRQDFQLKPGDINLVYGHNETGKTYIVESIISLLFRTGAKSVVDWNLRGWDFAGNIVVSGLEDKVVTFTKTSKKLDDYWEGQIGLPPDFSRLLVVKGGESLLLAREEDGVGRDILKNYLSGEGLLDKIGMKISTTLQKANVSDGQISGSNMGEIKKRNQLADDLVELNSLLTEAEDSYASGVVNDLKKKQATIKSELDASEKAKRYYAAGLHGKRKSLQKRGESLPSEEQLSQIESDISVYEDRKTEADIKSENLVRLESVTENYRWAEQALNVYKEITSGQAITAPKTVYIAVALLLLIGAVVTGFLNLKIPLVICAAGSLVFSILYLVGVRRAFVTAGSNKELERLKAEFKNRYGSDLTDRALLEAHVGRLREDYYRATGLKKELDDELTPNLKIQESNIKIELKKFTGKDPLQQQWRQIVSELRSELNGITSEINSLDLELASLEVSEDELLDQDPGAEWDCERYETCAEDYTVTTEALEKELQKLEHLRTRIAQETRLDSTDWEDLITALRDVREEVAEDYRLVTAEILAKIQVNTVIKEFREEENTRIAAGLKSEELTKPLYAVTSHYREIRHEVDEGLVLTTDEDEEYRLAEISSGAQEQVFLALRMGFSSIIMEGKTAFLILDDAFQHSDWPRRTNMIDQVLGLTKSGWQVFYFAMDDHIRDLFLTAGKGMGDRFRSVDLLD